jgi:hypothetical protein
MSGSSSSRAVTSPARESPLVSLLTLRRTRALVRSRRGRAVAIGIALVYGFVALLAGYMLQFGPTGTSGTTVEVLTNSASPAWWNYPALLVIVPGGLLALPFLATISMVLVSVGVGLGMTAGLVLATRFFRSWKLARSGHGPANSLAGLTPAMVALLTLGACCSTSAAAVGGIGALAEASGTSYNQLLLHPWFLNVFQVAVLGIALLAQEQLIAVYGNLMPSSSEAPIPTPKGAASEPRRGRVPIVVLRGFLILAGTVWSLSLLLELASPTPGDPIAVLVAGGLLQHVVLGTAAIAAGLAPAILLSVPSTGKYRATIAAGRGLLFVGAVSVVVGVPPPLSNWGFYGLGNEILGAVGVSRSLGGVYAPGGNGVAIDLGIAAVYATLGLLTLLIALEPGPILRRFAGRVETTMEPAKITPRHPSLSGSDTHGRGAHGVEDPY